MPGKFIKKMSKKSLASVEPEASSSTPVLSVEESSSKVSPDPVVVQPSPLENKLCNRTPLSLDPLDHTKNTHKKKRGKMSRANLKKKRENKHAVNIQSKWRGHCARKSITERKAQKEAEKLLEPDKDNAEEEKLEDFMKIPFEQIKRVDFCVDGAVGLPVNCTATRVSCRLLQQDRIPLSEAGESFADPETPVTSPAYDLFMSWKGSDKHESHEISSS